MTNGSDRLRSLFPLIVALTLITGILIGSRFSIFSSASALKRSKDDKNLNELIGYILDNYVDTVNVKQLRRSAIDGMLESLDPHSSYIAIEDFHAMTDPLRGNFEGIGIQFRQIKDTVVVIQALPGGPSEKAGLMAGDRIIKVDGKKVAGVKMPDDSIVKKLKGPKGSTVRVDIFRRGRKGLIPFTLTRDVIPTFSIDAAYMIDPKTAYIKLSRFAATTTAEMQDALKTLRRAGMRSLILDLRGNSGGYLEAAIELADEFLPAGAKIVYTEGRKRPREEYPATARGLFEDGKIAILIDEGSASASEIVAGAIQDNDRGFIIGRRSFGKGLVQEQLELKDGSAVRLTVARYYTPTGRSIQRPYTGDTEDYSHEFLQRYNNGEMEHPDSLQFADSLKFTTPGGKTVYGGGGIMPDEYIAIDKKDAVRQYYYKVANSNSLYRLSFEYTDTKRDLLAKYPDYESFEKGFEVPAELFGRLVNELYSEGLEKNPALLAKAKAEITTLFKAHIARNIFDDKGFYPIYNRNDKTVLRAVELLK